MVTAVETGSDNLCAAMKGQNFSQKLEFEDRSALRESQKKALAGQEIDRQIDRLVKLRDLVILSEE